MLYSVLVALLRCRYRGGQSGEQWSTGASEPDIHLGLLALATMIIERLDGVTKHHLVHDRSSNALAVRVQRVTPHLPPARRVDAL